MTAPMLFAAGDSGEGAIPPQVDEQERDSHRGRVRAEPASLYRRYRPQSFAADALVGQDHVVRTLRNAISLDRVAHAYLFSGPRGTGKTTTARLLAKAINCLAVDREQRPCNECENCFAINAGASPDVIEIDAASNRGIDDIRDLRDRVRYAPSHLPTKVYIIDEAHQITGAAANAFLKTLEEPPPHAVFILATTDPEELLPTIVSRCQSYEFRRISVDDLVRHLTHVAAEEGIGVNPEALREIARHATGSARDALGLLEQLALSTGQRAGSADRLPIEVLDVRSALGLSANERVEAIFAAIGDGSAAQALTVIQDSLDAGEDPRQLNRQLLGYARQLLQVRSGSSTVADERANHLARLFSLSGLASIAKLFGEIDFSIKHAPLPQLPLEIAIIEAIGFLADEESRPTGVRNEVARVDDKRDNPQPPPTSLRDRVRGAPTPQDRPQLADASKLPASITPLHPTSDAKPVVVPAATAVGGAETIDVDRIASLWPQVRADVKTVNRRIEALLSEIDPVAVAGNQITVAAPYPFHRDKLNSDEVRETVSRVLSRLLGREISLVCVLRGEVSAGPVSAFPAVAPAAPLTEPVPSSDNSDAVEAIVRAALNIFDAEEISPQGNS